MRLWPRTLVGQLILLLLLALFTAQLLAALIFLDERRLAVAQAAREQVLARTVSLVRLLERTRPELHAALLQAASGGRLRYRLSTAPALDPADPRHARNRFARALARALDRAPGAVLVDVHRGGRLWPWRRGELVLVRPLRADDDDDDDFFEEPWEDEPDRMEHPARGPRSLVLAVRLADGRWLNGELAPPAPARLWAAPFLLALVLAAGGTAGITWLFLRRLTRPLTALARAAELLGRGGEPPPLPEGGPSEIRNTVRAFNLMQERLQRFVEDRTRMLAALGHDLRTPITALKIRAELIEDDTHRRRLLETLEEMERMVEGTLAFLREEASREPHRRVALRQLLESLVQDYRDMGRPVRLGPCPEVLLTCRPDGLRRALRNLVDNALRYGETAEVRAELAPEQVYILVEDEGPGIPPEMLERVFEPFLRLEESRSRETGGLGLGLAIARTIARAHGGELRLENRPQGGLRAVLLLPR